MFVQDLFMYHLWPHFLYFYLESKQLWLQFFKDLHALQTKRRHRKSRTSSTVNTIAGELELSI